MDTETARGTVGMLPPNVAIDFAVALDQATMSERAVYVGPVEITDLQLRALRVFADASWKTATFTIDVHDEREDGTYIRVQSP
jgi:hypothetical protein